MSEKKISPARKALQVRTRAKNKKPKFVRAESWRFARFSLSWRKPRGLDNKIRRKIKGWPPGPSTGYKGPKIARYLHPSGYREVIVHNVDDLANIDAQTHAIRIGHTVGKRKRADIITKAKELNLKILNFTLTPKPSDVEEPEDENDEDKKEAEAKAKAKEKAKLKKEKKPKKAPKKEKKPKPKKGDKKQ
ncbi:MAG: 50S ribosomal protein L32e [Nitrososphaerota archaeon]|jgi:large subunit ribosomal protein L32e|nr:50S ribosomal protein L32e [Nitrososphaerota archaeon]